VIFVTSALLCSMCALISSGSALALFLHHGAQDRDMFDAGRFDAIDALEVKAANDAKHRGQHRQDLDRPRRGPPLSTAAQ